MVLSMAVTSKTGISWGTAEEDGLVWAEQSTAVSNIEKTQRMRVVILASSCELFDTKHTVFSGQGRLEVTVQQVPESDHIRCPEHAYMSNVQTATHNTS